MKKKSISLVLALCLISMSIFSGCGKTDDSANEEKIRVDVCSTSQNNISVKTQFVGTIEPQDEIEVFAKMGGQVTETYFEVGDQVNEGEVLFTLDDEAAQLQVRTATANYNTAQAGVNQQVASLGMNHDSAVNSAETAKEGRAQINGTYGHYSDQWNDLEDQKNDLEEDKDDLKDDKKKARKKLRELKDSLPGAQEAAKKAQDAYNDALSRGVSGNELVILENAMNSANSALNSINSGISSLSSAISGYDSGIKQYENSIDQIESSQKNIGFQMDNLGYSAAQADRGSQLAQESLEYNDNVKAPATLQSAEATLQNAQVGLDSAQLQLDYTRITAPIAGVIKEKKIDKFDMASPGVTAYVISNKDSIIAKFYVTENAYRCFSIGQAVVIERNGNEYSGYISELPNAIDTATNLFEIKATINGTPAELIDGTSVKITTYTNHVENVMSMPVDCVYYESDKAYIYVVNNGVVEKRYIEVGLFDENNIQILSGVNPEDYIVCSWSSELRDGLAVDIDVKK